MNWQSLKIRHKLFLGFGIVVTVTALFGGILLSGLYSINNSSKDLYNNHIPALSQTYDLQNHWQKAIFNLRTFSTQKKEQYYVMANHHLNKAREILDSLKVESEQKKSKWEFIDRELAHFQKQARNSFSAALQVETSYSKLDSAQKRLHELSDNYLSLQYKKLKRDIDNGEANHIVKRRVDKINLMNEIVRTAENLKITIGETNFRNDPTLLDEVVPTLSIIDLNVGTILPMTTKQYDVKSLNEIKDQGEICKNAITKLTDNWKTYSKLNNHDFLERGLSLTMDMADKQENYLARSAKSNLQHASNARNIWWWSVSLSMLTAIFIAWRISRSLSDPIINLTALAEQQADGLLIEIPETTRNDEVGKLTRSMKLHQEQTHRIVDALKNMGISLNDLMQRLKERSERLTATTTSQASSAQEITASIEEMQALTENSSQETEQASIQIQKAKTDVALYIEQNREAIDHMQELMKRSSVISELASQTYILSLNASVEASRGGDESKGFGTIAKAMRELAEKIKNVSSELNDLTEKGQKTSDEANLNLDNISQIITYNENVLQRMATLSLQQNAETRQVASAIQELNLETQRTAQMAEAMSGEATRMNSHSDELQEILTFYRKEEKEEDSLPKVNQWEWAELLPNDEEKDTAAILKEEEISG
ncbi:methyl-accepting chemotaxis protein [Marinilabilia rubra]|uniref:Methyl-accepting chemotaxis protein n=2 Tax=Marinilabilia rubra TaxID=2162893 RepID=A0A2U2BCU8_9BACT|nr:methyl-accepting chemotaxis protein [Marinilabilia rubra]